MGKHTKPLYVCLDCGCDFDEPLGLKDFHTEIPSGGYEIIYVCPNCQETSYEDAFPCELCGLPIGESQGKYGLCASCEKKTEQRFETALRQDFTLEERLFLNKQYDGRYFGLDEDEKQLMD